MGYSTALPQAPAVPTAYFSYHLESSGTMRLVSMRNKVGNSTFSYSNAASKMTILARGCKFLGLGNVEVVNATHGTSALVRRSIGPVVSCPLVSSSSTTASIQPNNRWYSAGSGSSIKGEVSSNESATTSPPLSVPPEDNDETVMITVEEAQKPAPHSPIPVDLDRSKFTHETKFKLPDMEGNGRVTKWFKKEGDIIQRKDILCEIELESFSFSVDSDDEGFTIMGEIHVPEGHADPIKPGTTLCTILHPEEPSLVTKTKQ